MTFLKHEVAASGDDQSIKNDVTTAYQLKENQFTKRTHTMKTMTKAIHSSILATLDGMTATRDNSSTDASKSTEHAHGHSHD